MYAGSINRDHVHMLVGIPAQISVSRAVQYLKGKSSHRLLSEYKPLKKRYWGQRQWSRGYWIVKSGDVTDEVWKECMETQQPRGQMIIIRSQIYRGHTPSRRQKSALQIFEQFSINSAVHSMEPVRKLSCSRYDVTLMGGKNTSYISFSFMSN